MCKPARVCAACLVVALALGCSETEPIAPAARLVDLAPVGGNASKEGPGPSAAPQVKDEIAIARREALLQLGAELARTEQELAGERDAAQRAELQRQRALLCNTVQRHLQQLGDGMTPLRTILYSEWTEWDGEIIAVDPNESLAWIDLDAGDGLRTGAIFQVVSFQKGRRRRVAAFLEVC